MINFSNLSLNYKGTYRETASLKSPRRQKILSSDISNIILFCFRWLCDGVVMMDEARPAAAMLPLLCLLLCLGLFSPAAAIGLCCCTVILCTAILFCTSQCLLFLCSPLSFYYHYNPVIAPINPF